MTGPLALLGKRRFLPLFATQFLNAFNDNFYKMAMVLLVTFTIYRDPGAEASFNALAASLFILPFFLFSALAGQLADCTDKARMIRTIKSAEILIMCVGAAGIWFENVAVMLAALFAMGAQSAFFGPIKYAILPQHLPADEVLVGTGWVEAGTYIAILTGTIVGGLVSPQVAVVGVIGFALLGRWVAQKVPPAPPEADAGAMALDWNIVRSSWRQARAVLADPQICLTIISISFFWAIGSLLAAQFPPLVKNSLGGDKSVATLFAAIFSVGIAIGSIAVNRMLRGAVSARYSPVSVLVMGLFVLDFWWAVTYWPHAGQNAGGTLIAWRFFFANADGLRIVADLLGIAIAGGMFVVPLYAFLTTTVPKSQAARTVAANNIVNSGFMVGATLILMLLIEAGLDIADTLAMVAVATLLSAWLARRLVRTGAARVRPETASTPERTP